MSKIVLVAAHCCHLHNKCLRSSPSSANLCLALWKVNFEENVYFDYVCVCDEGVQRMRVNHWKICLHGVGTSWSCQSLCLLGDGNIVLWLINNAIIV